ncbi:MAG: hypothetical protein DWQ34_09680 [Planctomycetota bacterium]|nr:MAG: hypothetical protein DWQ34_09680 [Planctomycetota bacterium]REJ96501.1 MAG: hypothetical protein DWQ29_00805 [Planctomycetota bacterium]REK24746.1 MAG: hypothetical protein DWQ41_13500 [Planctomycetota bacterium]REK37816.1 MAG: hypothetical protein DWQ45_05925 [Planctomycetota bacterium]
MTGNEPNPKRLPQSTPGLCLLLTLFASGCLTQYNTKFPTLAPHSTEYERRESEIQDPFPENDLGPETGFRPPDYDQQRSEVQRAKERFDASILRQQHGSPQPGPVPGPTGSHYPEAVRQ